MALGEGWRYNKKRARVCMSRGLLSRLYSLQSDEVWTRKPGLAGHTVGGTARPEEPTPGDAYTSHEHSARTTTTTGRPRDMADGNLVRLGGVFGLLAVVANIPGYLVGYPDAASSPAEAGSYLDSGFGTFVFYNGVLPLFHSFFFVLFLGVLYGMLRHALDDAHRGVGLPAAALAGGVGYGARHLRGGPGDGCPAEVVGSGWLRGCAADALALSLAPSGRFGGAGMGGGGLLADAHRGRRV